MYQILVVDDEEQIRSLLRDVLMDNNYSVHTADNGNVALNLAEQNKYNLVICDLLMPEKEGLETITLLRKKSSDIKIIAISGSLLKSSADDPFLLAAKHLGADRVIPKTDSLSQIIAAVRDLLPDPELAHIDQEIINLLTSAEFSSIHDCIERITLWLNDPTICTNDKKAVIELIESRNFELLYDSFYRQLEFGTGGLRGIVGQGFNRINKYVIRRATQGLANYILKQGSSACSRGIAIAYDSRHTSEQFAREAACVLSANGICAYIFPTLNTTPCLSFAVRNLHCIAGICITASHNPPEYNGCKVYWEDGGQIVAPHDKAILAEVDKVTAFSQVRFHSLVEGQKLRSIRFVPDSLINDYYTAVRQCKLYPKTASPLRIVYTPLHGTGGIHAENILSTWGFNNVEVVSEQAIPDGNFPTIAKPNPEDRSAFDLALKKAAEYRAHLVMATDPDADRLAIAVYNPSYAQGLFAAQAKGDYVILNGNQIGVLLLDYILIARKENDSMPANPAIVKTIVTSYLLDKIAEDNEVRVFNTLTGFKYIGNLITKWEQESNSPTFIFGSEESFGYLNGTYVRDKDGVGAMCQCAEMIDTLHRQGKTACQRLIEIFDSYGAWQEDLMTIDLPSGQPGLNKVRELMELLRNNSPQSIAGLKIQHIVDYANHVVHEKIGNTQTSLAVDLNLPRSEVLELNLENDTHIYVRPSGTEPKIKFYLSACIAEGPAEQAYERVVRRIEELKAALLKICQ
ncbi:MAG: response regulator [Deltaproteobacteria bacterium]|nr:response regulator [Deltaproteobacteria bacterium]